MGQFRLWWIVAMVGGYLVGIPLVLLISLSIPYGGQPPLLIGFIGGGQLGATIGFAQWLVLRHNTTVNGLWIAATLLGGALGMAPGMYISESFAPPIVASYHLLAPWDAVLQYTPLGALFGLGVGLAQAWLLRRQPILAGWWSVANLLGCMVGHGAFAAIAGLVAAPLGIAGAFVAPGLIIGIITNDFALEIGQTIGDRESS